MYSCDNLCSMLEFKNILYNYTQIFRYLKKKKQYINTLFKI